jgi:deazaflavin-dependent oxidoreductase (nitroreductase family)
VLGAALRWDRLSGPDKMDEIGEQLAGWGVAVRLETRGRRTGSTVAVAVGYLDQADGSLVVAAGSPDADWARNLEADPRVRATLGDRAFDAIAEPLEPPAAAAAVTSLILKYGTPAEGLGRGPAFRIRPLAEPG